MEKIEISKLENMDEQQLRKLAEDKNINITMCQEKDIKFISGNTLI